MSSQTSLIARNVRLQEWADMIHECNNRPDDMTVTQWCSEHVFPNAIIITGWLR